MLRKIGTQLARYLSEPRDELSLQTTKPGDLSASLREGDVLLVEGTSRISSAVKYLTQSSWSHAAIFVGNVINQSNEQGEKPARILHEGFGFYGQAGSIAAFY